MLVRSTHTKSLMFQRDPGIKCPYWYKYYYQNFKIKCTCEFCSFFSQKYYSRTFSAVGSAVVLTGVLGSAEVGPRGRR